MGFLKDLKATAAEFQEEFDRETDPQGRLLMRATAFLIGSILTLVAIGLLVLLAKIAFYLIPGLVVAGGVYWYVAKYNKGDKNKDKPDFRKN